MSWPKVSYVSKYKYVPLNIYFSYWSFTIIYYSSYIHGLIRSTSIKSVTVQQKTHLLLTCCTTSVWRRLCSSHLKISFSKYTRPSSLFLFFISVAIILFYQITTVSVFIDPYTVYWLNCHWFWHRHNDNFNSNFNEFNFNHLLVLGRIDVWLLQPNSLYEYTLALLITV